MNKLIIGAVVAVAVLLGGLYALGALAVPGSIVSVTQQPDGSKHYDVKINEGLQGDAVLTTGEAQTPPATETVDPNFHRGREIESNAGDGVNYVAHVVISAVHPNGQEFYHYETHNLLVDAGKNWIRGQIGSTSPAGNGANYIALTNTAITPGASDTCLSGEITSNGLDRQQGTYATGSTGIYTVAKTFTATGSQSAQASALFTAGVTGTPCNNSDDGTEFSEATFTAVSLITNDQLTITWTVTVS